MLEIPSIGYISYITIISIGYRSYITIIKELSGNESSEWTTQFLYNCDILSMTFL